MPKSQSLSLPFAGYAVALALILSAATVALYELDAAATQSLGAIRAHEHRVSQSERLRWLSELYVAATRGFFITADPLFREKQSDVARRVSTLLRDLRRTEDDARASELLAHVARAASAYDRMQNELLSSHEETDGFADLAQAFERRLLPLRQELDAVTDRYVQHQQALLAEAYARIERRRAQTAALAGGLLALGALVASALFWYTSRLLARTYARERAALDRAERALAARDEVLGIVAHDLRNPLSAITMKAALLAESRDSDAVSRHAGSIASIAARMERLIASLLDVASIEAGKLSMHPTRCEVEPLVSEVVSVFEGAAAEKSVRLHSEVSAKLAVRADRERIFQVLSNLVGNALKFTPAGGTVRLTVDREGAFVRFSVSDTGPGIEPELLPRVFDRFWRKGGVKGTGLGLFISKGIVEAHGGAISVESQPGAGATFRFTLPAVD